MKNIIFVRKLGLIFNITILININYQDIGVIDPKLGPGLYYQFEEVICQ